MSILMISYNSDPLSVFGVTLVGFDSLHASNNQLEETQVSLHNEQLNG